MSAYKRARTRQLLARLSATDDPAEYLAALAALAEVSPRTCVRVLRQGYALLRRTGDR